MYKLARIFALLSAVALALAVPKSASAGTLKIGMAPPPLKAAKWIKGQPVASFEKGKVYVVDFWGTWCQPCRVTIPHLTQLAKKYAGKVNFTGISVWEDKNSAATGSTEYMAKVAAFVKDVGDKMDYNVAVDDPKGTLSDTWLAAAGQNGIPATFVIDRDSKLAWVGHPMAGLDEVLAKEIAGTFDPVAEAKKQEQRLALQQ